MELEGTIFLGKWNCFMAKFMYFTLLFNPHEENFNLVLNHCRLVYLKQTLCCQHFSCPITSTFSMALEVMHFNSHTQYGKWIFIFFRENHAKMVDETLVQRNLKNWSSSPSNLPPNHPDPKIALSWWYSPMVILNIKLCFFVPKVTFWLAHSIRLSCGLFRGKCDTFHYYAVADVHSISCGWNCIVCDVARAWH